MQLDLFKAELVIFPAGRTVEVRQMARFLMVVQGERADAYFRKVCRKMAARVRACGASEAMARAEIEAFRAAVQGELHRLTAAPLAAGSQS